MVYGGSCYTIVDHRLPGRQRGAESQVVQQDAGRLPRRRGAGAPGDQTRRRGLATRQRGAEGGGTWGADGTSRCYA